MFWKKKSEDETGSGVVRSIDTPIINSLTTKEQKEAEERDALIKSLEPIRQEALALADADRQAFLADYTNDLNTYKFECVRWGDFLNISVFRDNTRFGINKVVTAINLAGLKAITMNVGHPPKDDGTVSFQFQPVYDAAYNRIGRKVVYRRPHDSISVHDMINMGADGGAGEYNNYYGNVRDYVPIQINNFPNRPLDDTLFFDGLGIMLYIPHGKGEAVHEAIMKAKDVLKP